MYPSEFRLEGALFDSGRVSASDPADLLAEPNPTFKAEVELEAIELDFFKPITTRFNLWVDRGFLSAAGGHEFARETRRVELPQATIEGVQVDYVHTLATADVGSQRVEATQTAVQRASNAPDLLAQVAELRITKGSFGFVNKAKTPAYRAFVTETDLTLTNLSNHQTEGTAVTKLSGKFMRSGRAVVEGRFRAEKAGQHLDLAVRIEDVSLPTLNDTFRAYGNFDVAAGFFTFYLELTVEDRAISGYVKPLSRDLAVYDQAQDKDRPMLHKMYEELVGGVSKLFKNRAREEVDTKADLSGRLDNPNVRIMEVVVRLVENAFFRPTLPGFDRESKRAERVKGVTMRQDAARPPLSCSLSLARRGPELG